MMTFFLSVPLVVAAAASALRENEYEEADLVTTDGAKPVVKAVAVEVTVARRKKNFIVVLFIDRLCKLTMTTICGREAKVRMFQCSKQEMQ
mmetsp:Transcript_20682/g.34100  ORF Transcript_20682/g.34100 Transcript_20682/m.34100 type:complete len:91 (-) Transcript_20682:40-312(-)